MTMVSPQTLDDALAVLADGPSRVLAGGTDVFAATGARLTGAVLDLTRIPQLATIECGLGGWRIGAGVTWSALRHHPLPAAFDGLKAAAGEVGSVQIQNRATLAGNLCNASPAADGVPALLTLGASVEIASRDGCRTLPLADFLLGPRRTALGPREIVTAILVPPQPEGGVAAFTKLGSRHYLVISIAMVAVVLAAERNVICDARVAVGACSPVAVRLPELERDLLGASVAVVADLVTAAHFAPLSPIDDVRASATYRLEAARVLTGRTLATAAGRLAT